MKKQFLVTAGKSPVHPNREFVNGFRSWLETYSEVFANILSALDLNDLNKAKTTQMKFGRCGLWDLASELTDEFEQENLGREWDGEFYDEVDKFTNSKLGL